MKLPFMNINDVLNNWAANTPPIDEFTVENLLNAVGLDYSYYESLFRYLMSKRDFELIPKKVVLCPNNHKGESFMLEEQINEDYFDCFCGEEEFLADNLMIVFSFTEEFKEEALKKKSKIKLLQTV